MKFEGYWEGCCEFEQPGVAGSWVSEPFIPLGVSLQLEAINLGTSIEIDRYLIFLCLELT